MMFYTRVGIDQFEERVIGVLVRVETKIVEIK